MTTQARELAKLVSNAGDLSFIDDVTLKSDSAVLNFGADSDVSLTHVADTALLLNSTRRLQFGDSGTYINQSADGVLNLTSDTEVEINATTVDINANVDISGNLVLGGNITIGDADSDDISFGGELTSHIIPNADNTYDLGSSTKEWRNAYFDGTVTSDAFAGPLTGDVTGNVSGTAATVTTAAQSNITSLGTLTTLTVDNVIVNGTTIGHTSDTDLMTLADGVLTVAGELDAASLDISGNVDIDGVLETDNLTVGGAQGSDGQVLTSTGSGVAWEDASGGAVSAINNATANELVTIGSTTTELDATTLDISGDADIDGTLETDNLTVGGAQGSDGQVLTSTGSGVAWEDAGGGAVSAINNATANELVTIGSTTTELDAETKLVFDGEFLGVAVTPEANWANDANGIQFAGLGGLWGKSNQAASSAVNLTYNVYDHSSTGQAYIVTDEASMYQQDDGNHFFYTAASGSADAAISWSTAKLAIKQTGAVGINITSPDYKLQVNGTGTTMNDGTGACIMVNSLDNSTSMIMLGCAADPNAGGIGYSRSASRMWLTAGGGSENNSSAAFCLNGAGQVGIGKIPETEWDSAWKVLQVGAGAMAATTDYSQMSWSQNGKARGASSNSSWERIETGAATQYVHDAGSHYFKRAASANADVAISWQEQVNIKSNGIFEVIGKDGGETHQFQFHNNGAGDGTSTNCSLSVQGGNTLIQLMAWSSLGCRIGSRGGGWSGTATDVYHTAADATYLVGKSNGTAYLANGSTAVTSDQRLKKNITNMADGQLAKINALTVRNFEWKDARKTGAQTGLIAQEVESVISDAIEETAIAPDDNDTSRDFDGDVKIVKYGDVQMRLLKAVQELSADLDAAKARITTLEG